VKTCAVLVASREERGFYKSVQDVPEPLRTRLKESTSGANAGTILIADRAGRQRLTEAFARREAAAEKTRPSKPREKDFRPPESAHPQWLKWTAIFAGLALAGAIAAIFEIRW
jgi:hypothetical protein